MTTAARWRTALALVVTIAITVGMNRDGQYSAAGVLAVGVRSIRGAAAIDLVVVGREVFRFDTFGSEPYWTDTLLLHVVIESTLSPAAALKAGLKVDSDALPAGLLDRVNLRSPASTVALLKLNAIVGVKADVDSNNHITRIGFTCALCHSTVDNSVKPGVGRRLDGWPNRQLNVGAIIALSPALSAEQREIYNSWGAGKYDPRYNIDGQSTPVVLPPIYGLADVKNETYTADGAISYWNAYVAVTQMHGQGSFIDRRLGINIRRTPDLVRPKLAALRAYQLSLTTPEPPAASFDAASAARGRPIFDVSCARCHVGATGTDNNRGTLHSPAETGMDGRYAERSATNAYRTTPLRALWQHPPYFHDGSGKTLAIVVSHYNHFLGLDLSAGQRRDLVEYLKTL